MERFIRRSKIQHSARLIFLRHGRNTFERRCLNEQQNKIWIKAAAVRAIKTVAQTAVGVIGASALITEVDFVVVLSASALAGLVSLLTSIAGLPEVENV